MSRRRPARFALSKLDKAGCSALGAGQRADAVKKEMPSLGGSVPMHSVYIFSCKHARSVVCEMEMALAIISQKLEQRKDTPSRAAS